MLLRYCHHQIFVFIGELHLCVPCGITPFLWWGPLFVSFTWRAIQAGVLHSLWDHPLLVVEAFVCLFHLESYPSWSLALLVGSPPSCGGGLCLPLSPGELSKLESCTPCGITPFLWWRPLFASFTWRAIQAGVLHSLWDHPLLVVEAFVCLFHLESYPSWSLALLWDHPCWTGQTRSGPWPSRPATPITNILNVSTQVNCTDFPHRLYLLSHYQLDLYCCFLEHK